MNKIDFKYLDEALKELGLSDSSIEFAPHIRENFNNVIEELNVIKEKMNVEVKNSDWYF